MAKYSSCIYGHNTLLGGGVMGWCYGVVLGDDVGVWVEVREQRKIKGTTKPGWQSCKSLT